MKYKLTKSVVFHTQDDADILRRLEEAGKLRDGAFSPFIRSLLRQWVYGNTPVHSGECPPAPAGDIQLAIAQALDERHLTLGAIRQAMDAALSGIRIESATLPEAPETEEQPDWFDLLEEATIL